MLLIGRAGLVAWLLLLAACSRPAPNQAPAAVLGDPPVEAKLKVTTTTTLLTDLVRVIGGDDVAVTGLMGPGVDPHLYQASASDIDKLTGADLVLYHGLHLEGKLGEVLEQIGEQGRATEAACGTLGDSRLLGWDSSSPDAGPKDPHVWFDVTLWSHVAQQVAAVLAGHDPEHAEDYRARMEAYQAELDALHAWCREQAESLPPERRVLVTAHDAFQYFGRAYGFEVHGLQGISTAAQAGTADVQRLCDLIVSRRVPAIFVESSVPTRTIEAVQAAARARGHEVAIGGQLYSDALGEPDGEAGSYLGMVRANMTTIVTALRGDG